MTAACAIDRTVHHAIILEMTGPSIRNEEAKMRNTSLTLGGEDAGSEQTVAATGGQNAPVG